MPIPEAEDESQADCGLPESRELGEEVAVRDHDLLHELPEQGDGVTFGVFRDENRHQVNPAVRSAGDGEKAPQQDHGELGEERLHEPQPDGDP